MILARWKPARIVRPVCPTYLVQKERRQKKLLPPEVLSRRVFETKRLRERGVVDVLLDSAVQPARVSPHHVWASLVVYGNPYVVAQEASLKRVVRRGQVRHRRGGQPRVLHRGRGRRRVRYADQCNVVAAGELAVPVRAIVVGDPQLGAIRHNGTPRLPLRTARRCELAGSAPGCAAIRRESVEYVIVAGR